MYGKFIVRVEVIIRQSMVSSYYVSYMTVSYITSTGWLTTFGSSTIMNETDGPCKCHGQIWDRQMAKAAK